MKRCAVTYFISTRSEWAPQRIYVVYVVGPNDVQTPDRHYNSTPSQLWKTTYRPTNCKKNFEIKDKFRNRIFSASKHWRIFWRRPIFSQRKLIASIGDNAKVSLALQLLMHFVARLPCNTHHLHYYKIYWCWCCMTEHKVTQSQYTMSHLWHWGAILLHGAQRYKESWIVAIFALTGGRWSSDHMELPSNMKWHLKPLQYIPSSRSNSEIALWKDAQTCYRYAFCRKEYAASDLIATNTSAQRIGSWIPAPTWCSCIFISLITRVTIYFLTFRFAGTAQRSKDSNAVVGMPLWMPCSFAISLDQFPYHAFGTCEFQRHCSASTTSKKNSAFNRCIPTTPVVSTKDFRWRGRERTGYCGLRTGNHWEGSNWTSTWIWMRLSASERRRLLVKLRCERWLSRHPLCCRWVTCGLWRLCRGCLET